MHHPRRIIISRKGFDSSAGGCPSPIFPDGRMISLPIPSEKPGVSFADLSINGINFGDVVQDLTYKPRKNISTHKKAHNCHLDPDLRFNSLNRRTGWLPSFGQVKGTLSHLNNQGVDKGDLFLFFGLFRRVKKDHNGRWHYKKGTPEMHVIWGWLQIGEKLDIGQQPQNAKSTYPWLAYHPHLNEPLPPNNAIYVASPSLSLCPSVSGSGTFESFSKKLQLTADNCNFSKWMLPKWFKPNANKTPLSHHSEKNFEDLDDTHCYLNTVGRGQEFVLNTEEYPESLEWAKTIIGGANNDQ